MSSALVDGRASVDVPDHKNMHDALRVAELAIEIQLERMHVVEAINARDAVAKRLADAHVLINQKNAMIEGLKKARQFCSPIVDARSRPTTPLQEQGNLNRVDDLGSGLGMVMGGLQDNLGLKLDIPNRLKTRSPIGMIGGNASPPGYEEINMACTFHQTSPRSHSEEYPPKDNVLVRATSRQASPHNSRSTTPRIVVDDLCGLGYANTSEARDPEDISRARNTLLASLPLPAEIPEDSLKPIVIPSPFTLHEFLGNASGSLRASLSNYKVFQQLTTAWCPDREEHGYSLVPAFKCSTNPRVATAHRWSAVDVLARMNKPVECFYNKDGKWYYAGVYKPFRLQDLTTKEWESLSNEAAQAIIKDTLSGRKNTSPQNIYETGQLYAAGALKVACVGLQCVGFNNSMYRAILELANKCAQSGKWRASPVGPGPGAPWSITESHSEREGAAFEGDQGVEEDTGGRFKKRDSGWTDSGV